MKVLILMKSFEYLGLEFLSSCLRNEGYETKLIFDPMLFSDVYLHNNFLLQYFDSTDAVIEEAKKYKPDFILFSMLSDDVQWVKLRARQLKAVCNSIIIVGGVHPTAVPEQVVQYEFFDYAVTGEGEEILPNLLDNLVRGLSVDQIKGVFYKRGNRVLGEMNRHLIQDLDKYPPPDKELFYTAAPWAKKEYSLIVSRGCPYDCTYCHNNYLKKNWDKQGNYIRTRSVANVINELSESKSKYGYTTVNLWDDNILAVKNYAFDFFGEYADKIHVPFKTFVHPSSINKETARLLADANCWSVEIGVQSVDKRGRKICGRTETDEMIENSIHLLQEVGIQATVSVITGLPYENYEQLYLMAKFFANIKPDRILAFILRYYPKTDILSIGMEAGIISEEEKQHIEEGSYIGSFTSQSRMSSKEYNRLRGLLMLSNKMPPHTIEKLEKLHAERWIPDLSNFIQFANQTKGFLQPHNDLARLYRKRLLYYVTGKGRKWIRENKA